MMAWSATLAPVWMGCSVFGAALLVFGADHRVEDVDRVRRAGMRAGSKLGILSRW